MAHPPHGAARPPRTQQSKAISSPPPPSPSHIPLCRAMNLPEHCIGACMCGWHKRLCPPAPPAHAQCPPIHPCHHPLHFHTTYPSRLPWVCYMHTHYGSCIRKAQAEGGGHPAAPAHPPARAMHPPHPVCMPTHPIHLNTNPGAPYNPTEHAQREAGLLEAELCPPGSLPLFRPTSGHAASPHQYGIYTCPFYPHPCGPAIHSHFLLTTRCRHGPQQQV